MCTISNTQATCSARFERLQVQNYLIVWINDIIDRTKEDFNNSLIQLRSVVSDVEICLQPAQCIKTLNKHEGKAFIISPGVLGKSLLPEIHNIPQVYAIYIFCDEQVKDEKWTKDWRKIRGVFVSIESICESVKKIVRECDYSDISISLIPKRTTETVIAGDLNTETCAQLPPAYMYSVIFKEIILEMDDDDDDNKQMNDLVDYSRKKTVPESQLIEFQNRYHQESAIWWYTKNSFLYRSVNEALRSLDMEGMIKMGFFIRHLHLQLKKLHEEQLETFQKQFIVYRGQGLSKEGIQQLSESKGAFLSFNNFLSTSTDKDVAMNFAPNALITSEDVVSVLFIITIDPNKISVLMTPYAVINNYSAIPWEQEILFTMHTVFRVIDAKLTCQNSHRWEVLLTITDENDSELAAITNQLKEEVQDSTGWRRMGKLVLKVGDFNQAEEFYNDLLKRKNDDGDRAHIYHQLGWLKDHQGQYQEATIFYEKSLQLKQKTVPEDDISLIPTYNSIAFAYQNIRNFLKALEFYEKVHKICQSVVPSNCSSLAFSGSNISSLCDNTDNYLKTLELYEQSLKIIKKPWPLNQLSLSSSYSRIGQAYSNMGDYAKALKFYQKSLEIKKRALPPNHPDFAVLYSRLGEVYRNMEDYPKSMDNFRKCLAIWPRALPENHPYLAFIYSNIGDVYRLMGDYPNALEYHQNALDIQRNVICNPLECAAIYVNLGEIYHELKDYLTALIYYEKGLKIRQENLPKNHPDLILVYRNMSKLYFGYGTI